jgi:hypothetical protein
VVDGGVVSDEKQAPKHVSVRVDDIVALAKAHNRWLRWALDPDRQRSVVRKLDNAICDLIDHVDEAAIDEALRLGKEDGR